MITLLNKIVQRVGEAPDLKSAMELIVSYVIDAVDTDVASVYLMESDEQTLTLRATRGLDQDNVGRLKLDKSEGLVGLVATRGETVNLDNAQNHPAFKYVDSLDESTYRAFLGVPIMHRGKALGVLVVQQCRSRRFDEIEESFLVTLSVQLAAAVIHAERSEITAQSGRKKGYSVSGVAAASGVAIGKGFVCQSQPLLDSVESGKAGSVKEELNAFDMALKATQADLDNYVSRLAEVLPAEELSIFNAYSKMLNDPEIITKTNELIKSGENAAFAIKSAFEGYIRRLEQTKDAYLRDRALDIKDIAEKLLGNLDESAIKTRACPDDAILIADQVTASMIAELPARKLRAVVSRTGGSYSHVALIAKALGIPAVMGVEGVDFSRLNDKPMIVDGYSGYVIVSPVKRVVNMYQRLIKEEDALNLQLGQLRNKPALTLDDVKMPLLVNTGMIAEITPSLNAGAEGVGLYRSEMPFMIREHFPTEEEQLNVYRHILKSFSPLPVTMRTLDIGGDKNLPYFSFEDENPFLGWRGIRISLDHPEIFMQQLRAMLRANEGIQNLQMLLPMITSLSEVDEALELIHRAHREVCEEYGGVGREIPLPKIGAMVEVPSMVYQITSLCERVDFLSIGTNDLTQYLLALDRNNAKIAHLYNSLHPAVIHAIHYVVKQAKESNTPVGICGELAGDPATTPLWLGMGIANLSMNASSLAKVKCVVRASESKACNRLLNRVLELETGEQIRAYLLQYLQSLDLDYLIRAGR